MMDYFSKIQMKILMFRNKNKEIICERKDVEILNTAEPKDKISAAFLAPLL